MCVCELAAYLLPHKSYSIYAFWKLAHIRTLSVSVPNIYSTHPTNICVCMHACMHVRGNPFYLQYNSKRSFIRPGWFSVFWAIFLVSPQFNMRPWKTTIHLASLTFTAHLDSIRCGPAKTDRLIVPNSGVWTLSISHYSFQKHFVFGAKMGNRSDLIARYTECDVEYPLNVICVAFTQMIFHLSLASWVNESLTHCANQPS